MIKTYLITACALTAIAYEHKIFPKDAGIYFEDAHNIAQITGTFRVCHILDKESAKEERTLMEKMQKELVSLRPDSGIQYAAFLHQLVKWTQQQIEETKS